MCTEPVLLCLDEPAAGLNPRESAALNALLLAIREDHATSILLIEHDMTVVMEISDHVIVIEYGLKISDGTPDSVKNDPKVIAAYLGVEDDEVALGRGGGRRMTAPLLSLEHVTACYGNIVALRDVDLTVAKGEIVALIGANGAGKTTLMMTIFGNPRARAGRIVFEGRDITGLPTHQIARLGLAQSPEGRRIFRAHDGGGEPALGCGVRRRRFRHARSSTSPRSFRA